MKQLTRMELAAIKRTAQNSKSLRNKRETMFNKLEAIKTEIDSLDKMIEIWEAPVLKLTGGFSSTAILRALESDSLDTLGNANQLINNCTENTCTEEPIVKEYTNTSSPSTESIDTIPMLDTLSDVVNTSTEPIRDIF